MTREELKAKRKALGLTQAQLAQQLGVTSITISNWERGAYAIPPGLVLPESAKDGAPVIIKGLVTETTHPHFFEAAVPGAPRYGYKKNWRHPTGGHVWYDNAGRFWDHKGNQVFERATMPAPEPQSDLLKAMEAGDDATATKLIMGKLK